MNGMEIFNMLPQEDRLQALTGFIGKSEVLDILCKWLEQHHHLIPDFREFIEENYRNYPGDCSEGPGDPESDGKELLPDTEFMAEPDKIAQERVLVHKTGTGLTVAPHDEEENNP